MKHARARGQGTRDDASVKIKRALTATSTAGIAVLVQATLPSTSALLLSSRAAVVEQVDIHGLIGERRHRGPSRCRSGWEICGRRSSATDVPVSGMNVTCCPRALPFEAHHYTWHRFTVTSAGDVGAGARLVLRLLRLSRAKESLHRVVVCGMHR